MPDSFSDNREELIELYLKQESDGEYRFYSSKTGQPIKEHRIVSPIKLIQKGHTQSLETSLKAFKPERANAYCWGEIVTYQIKDSPRDPKIVRGVIYLEIEPSEAWGIKNQVLDKGLESYLAAPACDVCGTITVRSGSCFKCLNCGASMGTIS